MASNAVIEKMKKTVGIEAAQMVEDRNVIGLGTGSTTVYMIEELGRRVRQEGLKIIGIPTSFDASVIARNHGIPLRTLDDIEKIDIAVDGADEVDPEKNLIKGRGAAHLREKIVDSMATRFIVIVDESKLVNKLGSRCPVPLEVLPLAVGPVMNSITILGGTPSQRMAPQKDGPVFTDQGDMIVDAKFIDIENPAEMEKNLNNIPGILENGIFSGLATEIIIGKISEEMEIKVERQG